MHAKNCSFSILAILFAILALDLAVAGPAKTDQFSIPKGLDRNSAESVLQTANQCVQQQKWLMADLLYKRILDLMPGDLYATTRIQEISENVSSALTGLSDSDLHKYDELGAKILQPEELAKVPAMRMAMNAFRADGKIAEAMTYADSILKILPNDLEAAGIRTVWATQEISAGDSALRTGDLQTALAIIFALPDGAPGIMERKKQLNSVLAAHDALRNAISTETDIKENIERLSGLYPQDPILDEAKTKLAQVELKIDLQKGATLHFESSQTNKAPAYFDGYRTFTFRVMIDGTEVCSDDKQCTTNVIHYGTHNMTILATVLRINAWGTKRLPDLTLHKSLTILDGCHWSFLVTLDEREHILNINGFDNCKNFLK